MRERSLRRLYAAAALLGAGIATACGDSARALVGRGQNVSLSFAGARPPGTSGVMATGGALADSVVIVVGTDRLVITSVELVLREIELKRANVTDCDSAADEDACEEFTLGPQLVSLPLVPGTSTSLTVPVDSGAYSEVEFEIHKPGDDSLDVAFKQAYPAFADTSIRVGGTFNGTPFSFTSRLNEEQEFSFSPPLQIDASGSTTNLTIRVDVATWFRNPSTGALINPATANSGGQNQSVVEQNIKNSIEAFEDEDRDGDERDG